MVCTPTLFAVAIPKDLAVDLRAMAEGNGITSEALVLSILRGRVKDWRGQHRDALPAVPSYQTAPESVNEAVILALGDMATGDVSEIRARVTVLLRRPVGYRPLRSILLGMRDAGAIRRVCQGVYALPETRGRKLS